MRKSVRATLVAIALATFGFAASSPATAQTASIWSPDGGARLTVEAVNARTPVAMVEDIKCDGRGPIGYVMVGSYGYYPVKVPDGCNRSKTQTISVIAKSGDKVSYYICNQNSKVKSCSSVASFRVP